MRLKVIRRAKPDKLSHPGGMAENISGVSDFFLTFSQRVNSSRCCISPKICLVFGCSGPTNRKYISKYIDVLNCLPCGAGVALFSFILSNSKSFRK